MSSMTFFHVLFKSTTLISRGCHTHHRRLWNAGAQTGYRCLLHSTVLSWGPGPTIFHLAEIFLTRKCTFHYLTHWKEREDFLNLQKSQYSFPLTQWREFSQKQLNWKAESSSPQSLPAPTPKDAAIYQTFWTASLYFPAASLNNQRTNYLLTMLQSGSPDLGPPITLGSGHNSSTARRGLLPYLPAGWANPRI